VEGDTLTGIAQQYGVAVESIAQANGITDPSRLSVGQQLIIPGASQVPPTARPQPTATKAPPKPTQKPPPTATTKPTAATAEAQFTANVVWDPLVAPNCSGPAIAKQSIILDAAGNPVNGVRVEVDCYGNKWASHPSGTPGEYDPGHYDFAFGQSTPQDWTCTARVLDIGGQPVQSSQSVSIHFDTNDCNPHGSGHQVAIVNWTKHW
jgi:murein DD-endopeptidase MepM/ murein hydrolase activator NlpD